MSQKSGANRSESCQEGKHFLQSELKKCAYTPNSQAVGEKGQTIVLADGLGRLMQTGSSFLVTYASAAMVNLAQTHEVPELNAEMQNQRVGTTRVGTASTV